MLPGRFLFDVCSISPYICTILKFLRIIINDLESDQSLYNII